MNEQSKTICPRCRASRLVCWEELDTDQREVVKRLAGSADYSLSERKTTHRWCVNCWHEETQASALDT
jgi:Zn ribbon nucleic-acid-binding protein